MTAKKVNKYIFIDANIYRHLFSESEGFSEEIFQLLCKLTQKGNVTLLLPQQVKDEVERNRIGEWFIDTKLAIENKIRDLDKKKEKLKLEFSNYSHVSKIETQIVKDIKDLRKKIERIKLQFLSTRSSCCVKLNKLFNSAELIEEDKSILDKAFFRREKGNPPKEKDNNKLGDKIIWESLIFYLSKKRSERPVLIFVAKDNTAWKSGVSSELSFELWLQREFKEKTNGRVIFVNELSKIPDLTEEEQRKIKDEERKEELRIINLKLKTLIPARLRSSNTFTRSEQIMKAVESKIDLIDCDGVEQILKSSIENTANSIGPYNQVIDSGYAPFFFNNLFKKSIDIKCDLGIWKNFYTVLDKENQERFLGLKKLLEGQGVAFKTEELKLIGGSDVVDIEDIPF